MKSNKEILEILERGVEEIIPEKDFRSLLGSKKKLIIKELDTLKIPTIKIIIF